MAWSFNPFTGNLDLTGSSGAVVFEGEVETFADLPEVVGDPPVGSSYLVRTSTGVWLVNKRQSGIWIRRNNTGVRATDWEYGGDYPVNSVAGKTGNVTLTNSDISGLGSAATANLNAISDADLRIVGSTDATKKVAIEVDTNVPTGQTVTLTAPSSGGTIARTSDIPSTFAASAITSGVFDNARVNFAAPSAIGSTTPAAGSFTTLSASDIVTPANSSAAPPTTTSAAKGIQFTSLGGGTNQVAAYGSYAGTPTFGIGAGTGAGSLTEIAAFNLNGVTLNRALTVGNGTLTASAPVLTLSQTWNNAAVTFTGIRFDLTDTASASGSMFLDFRLGGSTFFSVGKDSSILVNTVNSGGAPVIQNGFFTVANNAALRWYTSGQPTTQLWTGGNDILEQRRGTNAQTFRLYNTFTSATNFERLNIIAQSAASVIIGTEKGSGGGTARALEFRTDNTARLTIGSGGGFTLADAQDIAVGTTTGTKIGTGTTQKIGFFNATPVVQPAAVADATDAASTQARLNDLLARLRTLGLIAT